MMNSEASQSISPLEARSVEFAIGASRKYLIPFCILTQKGYQANWHHEYLAKRLEKALEELQKGKSTRLIVEMPPRHGKSETTTIKFPAWTLGKYPTLPIMVCAHTSDLASDFGQYTRDVMTSDRYRAVFKTDLRPDSTAKGRWMTKEGGSYTATGVGGPITGRGFKIGIIDDPFKSREEADSAVTRESVWRWYTGTFYTRQEGASIIIIINTRWHFDDLVGRIEEQEQKFIAAGVPHDEWEYISFPAIAEEDEGFRKRGEALWPWKFPLEQLEVIRNNVGVYEWSSQYQQQPISAETQEFSKHDFRYFDEEDLKNKLLRYTTTVDLAIGQNQEADNTVIRTCAKEVNGPHIYLIEETAGHLDPGKTIEATFYHQEKYKSEVFVETVAYQKALKFFLEEEQRRRQRYFVVHELSRNTTQSKVMRIRGLIPLYKAGVIWHRRGDVELERELLQFPKGKHDDRIDALASQLEALENTEHPRPRRPRKAWEPYSPMAGI